MTKRYFECDSCDSRGKIILKGDDYSASDIVCCPVCGADIYEDDEEDEDFREEE